MVPRMPPDLVDCEPDNDVPVDSEEFEFEDHDMRHDADREDLRPPFTAEAAAAGCCCICL